MHIPSNTRTHAYDNYAVALWSIGGLLRRRNGISSPQGWTWSQDNFSGDATIETPMRKSAQVQPTSQSHSLGIRRGPSLSRGRWFSFTRDAAAGRNERRTSVKSVLSGV